MLARSEEGSSDGRGLSLFLVERDETVKIRRLENKMGLHASPTCELQYTNTPAELIGKRRFGLMRYSMALMNGARLAVAAQALGIAEAAYREADRYSRERIQFGKPIREIIPVARMLVTMRGELEAARALLAETGTWVDLLKAYEHSAAAGDKTMDDDLSRVRQKQAATIAETLTPIAKYYCTEMGNRGGRHCQRGLASLPLLDCARRSVATFFHNDHNDSPGLGLVCHHSSILESYQVVRLIHDI